MLRLLRDVYASLAHLNHPWWEQRAYMDLMTGPAARPQYKALLALLPQRMLNSYPAGTGRPEGWWATGDLVLHFAGSKGDAFARRVEDGVVGAAPPCAAGAEEAVWLTRAGANSSAAAESSARGSGSAEGAP